MYALIVIYNKKISESLTYMLIKKYQDNVKLIVHDNSDELFIKSNKQFCEKNKIKYFTLNENVGISKAYNHVIRNIEKKDDEYIMIFDDDTQISDEYINEAIRLSKEKIADVILPIIISNKRIISPANVQFKCRIKILDNLNQLDINRISAINSGMIIRTSVFNNLNYNEKIFLDYVDHDIMKKFRENNLKIVVMKSNIIQNYARFQNNKLEAEITRFKIYLKDFKVYCKECHNLLFYYLSVFKYKIVECKKYKTIKFLFFR